MWWARDPARFHLELAGMNELQARASWLKGLAWRVSSELVPEVSLILEVHGKEYELTLVYPEFFPDAPAYVRPTDNRQRLSGHQYGVGGSLCLESRPDNWTREVTGAELVESAHRLLAAEKDPDTPATVPSAHKTTVGQDARGTWNRLVLSGSVVSMLREMPDRSSARFQGAFVVHDVAEGNVARVAFVLKLGTPGSEPLPVPDVPQALATTGPLWNVDYEGIVLKDESFKAIRSMQTMGDLWAALEAAGFARAVLDLPAQESTQTPSRLVMLASSGDALAWFLRADGETFSLSPAHVVSAGPGGRLPQTASDLTSKKVGIVGLGSVGSKVAASLARSGVRRFLLIDGDLLLPENLVRHELSWASVGMHKASALSQELALLAPEVEVVQHLHDVGGQESPARANQVFKQLGDCDLIIDATADPYVFADLAALARVRRRPICWGEVFAGGLGALVARARPDLDPNPMSVRNAIDAYLQGLPPAPHRDARGYDGQPGSMLVAYDSDVAQLAAVLTRMCIDILVGSTESTFPHPAYLIGYRKGWLEAPFDTRPIDATGDGWDDPAGPVDQDLLASAVSFVTKALQERAHAEPSA